MAFKPSQKRSREEQSTEINITPIMNLMVVLIPLLLSASKFTELALLEYLPPAEGAPVEAGAAPSEESDANTEKINLLLNLVETGIQVSIFQSVEEGPNFYEIPVIASGDYNWETLKDSLWSIKQTHVGEPTGIDTVVVEATGKSTEIATYRVLDGEEVSITAVASTTFQTVIKVMDACRYITIGNEQKTLFPLTILKQFQ